jgi:Ca2+-binding EF-hand superfamily protein
LTERKKKMVDKAFRSLDRDGSGVITVQDIISTYDVSKDKEFISGKKSKE